MNINEISGPIKEVDLKGKTLVVKASALTEPWASGDRRFKAIHGFGCNPEAMGTAVFGEFLADGEKCRMERYQFEGLAAHE